ncbi:MAG TPA: hypothetical protein VG323_16050 [Thermoanaerobaculia bacterium]|nr:hypothetical protein [Thermoanaerobaculia bacterium]
MKEEDGDRRIAAGLFLLVFVTYAFFFNGGGWNQNAHFDLTRAVVELRSIRIDTYDSNTGDISLGRRGHIFANKPPGASFLGAIPYAVVYAVERAAHADLGSWLVATLNLYLLTMLVCGVSGALIAAVIYLDLRRRAGATRRTALAVALLFAFGTFIFAYSTVYFAQVPAALFLLLAFVWLDDHPWRAGAAAGLAGTCFYVCIPAAVAMAIFAFARSRANALRFIVAGLPFGVALAAYHKAAFGSPWRTAVEGSGAFVQKGALLGVLLRPSATALWGITFSRWRGLFAISPVLLFAFAGAVVMLRRRALRRELAIVAVVAAIFILSIISFNGWHGGSAVGPRYLLPVVPLLAIPMLFATSMLRPLWIVLGVVSIAINILAAAVDPMPGAPIPWPLRDEYLPTFLHGRPPAGRVAINDQAADELGPSMKYPPESRESRWASFNLGELVFGQGSIASLLPVLLWMSAGTVVLWRRGKP